MQQVSLPDSDESASSNSEVDETIVVSSGNSEPESDQQRRTRNSMPASRTHFNHRPTRAARPANLRETADEGRGNRARTQVRRIESSSAESSSESDHRP